MTRTHKMKLGLAMIAAIGIGTAAPAIAQQTQSDEGALASAALADGQAFTAIDLISAELRERPNDPALLINLGIAYAHTGDEARARLQFESALASRDVVQLETADGRTIDSRRLARQAMAMLERGEFRPSPRSGEQLTLRNREGSF